ncbi:cellular Repressor of E1A-stimulated Genes [Musca autumnalis]|uniref:cellular Repressor of E1A-stimulated Genes n=1 Tax=Musca autumnalis TaxID=221902 RepID=UPI003CF19840
MKNKFLALLLVTVYFNYSLGYSAYEDARIIAEYKKSLKLNNDKAGEDPKELDHVAIARKLVHQTNWASVGTISTNPTTKGYPMVNIIAINDNDVDQKSTGRIQFLLTDLDFTGQDWQVTNKTTFLFSDEQGLHCSRPSGWNPPPVDPMEPTCARAMISGQIKRMDKNSREYPTALVSFTDRHPAAKEWLKKHDFYLCELEIENIFVLDYYGGPHTVKPEDYYNVIL